MAKKREDPPKKGSPEWMSTFGDLMNLLLCFFVLLFSMSSVDAAKFEKIAESFNESFSIFDSGGQSLDDSVLISNGVSQLNELDQYMNSTGKAAQSDEEVDATKEYDQLAEALEEQKLKVSEQLAEKISEAVDESNLTDQISINFTSQYVQLTLKGALLFDSGKADIKQEAIPVLDKIGVILVKYAENTIEIEGHTDNVPVTGGKYEDNDELSGARALSVFDYLISTTDLNPANIKHSGRGEYVPIADNSTEEGRAMNRRVEIRIYHSLSDT